MSRLKCEDARLKPGATIAGAALLPVLRDVPRCIIKTGRLPASPTVAMILISADGAGGEAVRTWLKFSRDAVELGLGSGQRMGLEELPDDFVCVEVAAGLANEKLREVLFAARPGVAAADNAVKSDCDILLTT